MRSFGALFGEAEGVLCYVFLRGGLGGRQPPQPPERDGKSFWRENDEKLKNLCDFPKCLGNVLVWYGDGSGAI